MLIKRWQDWVTLVAGIWFAIAPWVLGHGESETVVVYNAIAVGFALVLFSGGALSKPDTWEEVVDFVVGIWTMASPWALGFTGLHDLTTNAVVVGLIVAILAGWTAMDRSHLIERWRQRGPV